MRKLILGLVLAAGLSVLSVALATDTTSRLFDREQLQITTGTATVNSMTADYSKWQPLVTITPEATHALQDVRVTLDLGKASTGFGAVYTTGTITASIQRKVDGTNWRTDNNLATPTVTGTLAGATGEQLALELVVGEVGPAQSLRIVVRISSVSNTNVTLPYVVTYRAGAKATITPAS